MKIIFKLSEDKESNLSKDVEILLKKEGSKKIENPHTFIDKEERSI